ncbi:hypothetical protein [Paenibacillus planticolens]|uniref:hypothetical protein n=1 Tax=Paenibacillus planticolens TaxID=2654976 RepID=UPI0014923278|nr:hypothetical protein [Paenibacillus planticolens]
MKNKIGLISFILFYFILFLSFVVAVYQDSHRKKETIVEFPDIEDVVSVVIVIGGESY